MSDYIRQKKILEKIMEAEVDLIDALREAPYWLDEVLDEIRDAVRAPSISRSHSRSQSISRSHSTSQQDNSLPGSTEAIMNLLREHPRGLPAREIVSQLVGKIRTKSMDEKKLLYAVLVTLVRGEKLRKTADGHYILPG
jgi:hypothetical protein